MPRRRRAWRPRSRHGSPRGAPSLADAVGGVLDGTPLPALVEPDLLAHAVVALYLGLEMLAHLDGDRAPSLALFDRARQLAALLETFGAFPAREETT